MALKPGPSERCAQCGQGLVPVACYCDECGTPWTSQALWVRLGTVGGLVGLAGGVLAVGRAWWAYWQGQSADPWLILGNTVALLGLGLLVLRRWPR